MGLHRRYSAALLAFSLSSVAFATERVSVDPYIKAGPGYTAATGSITGYVPTKSNSDLFLEAERKGWLGSAATKTPILVKPKVSIPVSGIASKAKNLLKVSPAQVAGQLAFAGLLAGVDWVMSDDNTKLQKKSVPTEPVATDASKGEYTWKVTNISGNYSSPYLGCEQFRASYTVYVSTDISFTSQTSGQCVFTNLSGAKVSTAASFTRSGSSCPTGSTYDSSQGACFGAATKTDVTDSDFDMLDPWMNQQSADWLKELLTESCVGSNNPQACYDDLQKQSVAIISGPTSVQGPQTTSTGTYLRSDGTTGTTSSTTNTTYNITYGSNNYDYSTVKTTTNTKDGQVTDSNTTTDSGTPQETPSDDDSEDQEKDYVVTDTALPQIDPFYEQQYPDGLQGVWNEKQAEFQDSAFLSFLHSFVPNFSGSCPAFSLSFAIAAWANYGTIHFTSICYALDLVKVVILVSALFLCRALIFGG
ncbi:MAG: hypothetical protein GAK45_00288 [Pseudomonas citronellolis]|nr:MAG: hypothetical protein GAK45_00288 [Pseudomonas citronellolis]